MSFSSISSSAASSSTAMSVCQEPTEHFKLVRSARKLTALLGALPPPQALVPVKKQHKRTHSRPLPSPPVRPLPLKPSLSLEKLNDTLRSRLNDTSAPPPSSASDESIYSQPSPLTPRDMNSGFVFTDPWNGNQKVTHNLKLQIEDEYMGEPALKSHFSPITPTPIEFAAADYFMNAPPLPPASPTPSMIADDETTPPSTAPLVSPSPTCTSFSLASPPLTPLYSSFSPSTHTPPRRTATEVRRRRLAKLTRTLGEGVPPELVPVCLPPAAKRSRTRRHHRRSYLELPSENHHNHDRDSLSPFVTTRTRSGVPFAARKDSRTMLSHLKGSKSRKAGGEKEKGRKDTPSWTGAWNMEIEDVQKGLRSLKV